MFSTCFKIRQVGVTRDMELFLVQHGEAKSETEDPERPLTDRGAETVVRMAACSWPADPLVK